MKKHKVMGMILCLLPLAAFLLAYNRLPQQVPIHLIYGARQMVFCLKSGRLLGSQGCLC